MYMPRLIAFTTFLVIIVYNSYSRYCVSILASLHSSPANGTSSMVVEAATKKNATYTSDIISLHTLLECNMTFHVLLLLL
ncbi:hypothetical protein F5Y09DRAFT_141634 [Xylaria sp. FL1042]|nr:hypothetical protein F5Y09DRAFT_141634 [Xylaria sp. FL1042]